MGTLKENADTEEKPLRTTLSGPGSAASKEKEKEMSTKVSRAVANGYKRALVRFAAVMAIPALVLFLHGVASPSTGRADSSGSNGRIAFEVGQEFPSSFDIKTFEIYVMDADGGNRTRLTDNSVGDRWPNWSPDGQKIAFTRFHEDGTADIYVMNADGSHETNLTNTPEFDEITPAWSPNGKTIAFTRGPAGSFVAFFGFDQYEILVMDADGHSGLKRLTSNASEDSAPAWSPDGKQIAFTSTRDGNYEVYVMKANGKRPTNLTNNPAEDGFTLPALAWSPDGQRIAFPSNRDGADFSDFDIYAMMADGSNQTNLTNRRGFDGAPAWSPDGSKITFNQVEAGIHDVYAMNATDGSGPTNLTSTPADDEDEVASSWQPIPK